MNRLPRLIVVATFVLLLSGLFRAQGVAVDPGVRSGQSAGGPLPGLSTGQFSAFQAGADDFNTSHSVDGRFPDADATGLGPVFNLDNCGGCHAFPAVGGTSPAINPQVEMATKAGADNAIPFFIGLNGPVREARFISKPDGSPDGGVHALFTVTGRSDARALSRASASVLRVSTVIF